jgi:hypothetical protein
MGNLLEELNTQVRDYLSKTKLNNLVSIYRSMNVNA